MTDGSLNHLLILLCAPIAWIAFAFFIKSARMVSATSMLCSWAHVGAVLYVCWKVVFHGAPPLQLCPGFRLDQMSGSFLILTAVVTAACMSHAYQYFSDAEKTEHAPAPRHLRLFYGSVALFLTAMSSVFICDNLGYLWISVETTTLVSAPLVYFERTKEALEATWKYLIICSVGIAFALVGTIFVFAASQQGLTHEGTLNISQLIANAATLNYPLFKLGYVFCFLGYGTKAGIFPLHSWLPDAHSEAPAPASAMLSGSLLNCALFAILRLSAIETACHRGALSSTLAVTAGVVTVVAAGLFLVRQHGLKRLWAYSSIENVGLMLVAIGLGSGTLFLLQAINHSLAKVALFLLSGNIVAATGTKELRQIRGLMSFAPGSGLLLSLAALAITGVPPFGAFISEWLILNANVALQAWWVVAGLLVGLSLAFLAICIHIGHILLGTPRADWRPAPAPSRALVPLVLVVLCLCLGLGTQPALLEGQHGMDLSNNPRANGGL